MVMLGSQTMVATAKMSEVMGKSADVSVSKSCALLGSDQVAPRCH